MWPFIERLEYMTTIGIHYRCDSIPKVREILDEVLVLHKNPPDRY